jgi:hypothetical protein
MSQVDKTQTRSLIRNQWNETISSMGGKDLTRFLRHSWISRFGDVKSHSLYHELIEQIKSNKQNAIQFVSDCHTDAEQYNIILGDAESDYPSEARLYIDGIVKYYRSTPAIPLILAARRSLNNTHFISALKAINAFVFRYSEVMNLNPSGMESILYRLAEETNDHHIKKINQRVIKNNIRDVLSGHLPSDEQVETALEHLEFDNPPALWTLYQLELLKNPDSVLDLKSLSVEHILPDNPDSKEWPNAKKIEKFTFLIGNLTLISKKSNSSLGNKSFIKKKPVYLKSGIYINRYFKPVTEWNVATLESRRDRLIGDIINTISI